MSESRPENGVKPLWMIWAFEIACILLSCLLFIAIVSILWIFNDGTLPDWPLRITLNSFVAFLTTLATAAFAVPVSTAMGQMQWIWFNRETPQPLYDLHIVDQASRGAWGSFLLLSRIRLQHFVAIGALVLAISGLTSPLTQLAINYSTRNATLLGTEKAETHAVRDLSVPRDSFGLITAYSVFLAGILDRSEWKGPISHEDAATAGSVSC
ncbi:hypothetical protein CSOJ01_13257 [Colletotrichum sojae]|uniref:Uncharacterized protein n=1 Tax=Colletotrichum sojae TaxID=2175907 RepID=A0A8H6ITI9_9PEZI|nr:hypothetical protein CSOJ01_13257 [Colletotrichum sojae]